MARNANDTEPMSDRQESGDPDDVDSMLNALQVSPERGRKRTPEITPAPEAIAKARSGQGAQVAGGKKRPQSARTVPMGGAPPLPKEVVNARVASDPAEQAFLNKTEETAPRRRRDEKTMLTGMKPPEAPASSYLVSAAIAFVAVLAVGLIGWRVMKYVESQGPARGDDPAQAADVRGAGKPANTGAASPSAAPALPATPGTGATGATGVSPPRPASTAVAPTVTTADPGPTALPAPVASAKPAGRPGAPASAAASPPGSTPSGKYGGMVSPELQ